MNQEVKFLYVIGADVDGPVKLGISGDPERRVRQLQTGHAQRLSLYHQEPVAASQARLYERLLHQAFSTQRTHGEWFAMSVEQARDSIQFIMIEHTPSELVA